MFCTEIGTPLEPRNVARWYATVAASAGVPGSLHTLRHSAASTLLASGASLRLVADVLGHSSVQITGDVYAHALEDAKHAAVLAAERAFGL